MFSKCDFKWFATGGTLCLLGFLSFAFDPVENGFGFLTLWLGPIVFVLGLLFVIPGILGSDWSILKIPFRFHSAKYAFGAVAFLIAFVTYLITLEPTASLWDCSEFIASAYKLQVPHTPGNPLLLLVGRIFSMLSFGNPQNVAWAVNLMSAFFSAATVWLVYLIILHVGRKISGNSWSRIVAALTGSLILTFSDTFWFSAVEAETYAASSFFMAMLLLLILKGSEMHGVIKERMLLLISYVAGLAFCVHPMCVLALPLLPFTWFLHTRRLSIKNILIGTSAGIGIVLFINRFIAVGVFELAFFSDLFAVNVLGLPFYTGSVLLIAITCLSFYLAIKKLPFIRIYSSPVIFFLVAFSPYGILFIRSGHNPPIDESNPENLPLIKAYMNREGYPTRPLLFGPYFDADVESAVPKGNVYYKGKSRYEMAGTITEYQYTRGRQTILPRLYSNDPDHIETYKRWTGIQQNEKPSFIHNLTFMLHYQLGHMYFRYLMFNFAGRRSDVQGEGWLKPWESRNKGENLYETKARNQYWMIPIALGVAGMVLLFWKDKRTFLTVFFFFCISGFLLALYLNATPNEPRERDYIYVGSYMAFAIFAGAGALGFIGSLQNRKLQAIPAVACIAIPAWMMTENFDDHNRAGRTFQIDNARNILASCEPHSILFTGGDNDTFPLWYLQEVENFRTDVRVVVLSYLNTDWYINQLRKQYYESTPFTLSIGVDGYRQYGANDVLYVQEQFKSSIDLRRFLQLLEENHPGLKIQTSNNESYSIAPAKSFVLDGQRFQKVNDDKDSKSNGQIVLQIKGSHLTKNGLAILDLLANNPHRSFHFNFTSLMQTGLNLDEYVIQKGQLFQFHPVRSEAPNPPVDTAAAYKNLVEKMDYTNLVDDSYYLNYEDYQARIIQPLRMSFNALAIALIQEGNQKVAGDVLSHALLYLYPDHILPSFANAQTADLLRRLGRDDEAARIAVELFNYAYSQGASEGFDQINMQLAQFAAEMLNELGKQEYLAKLEKEGPSLR